VPGLKEPTASDGRRGGEGERESVWEAERGPRARSKLPHPSPPSHRSPDERDFADEASADDSSSDGSSDGGGSADAAPPPAKRPRAPAAPRRKPSATTTTSSSDDGSASDSDGGGGRPAPPPRADAPVARPASTAAAAAAADAVLAHDRAADAFRVKLRGVGHRWAVWVPGADLRAARPALARAAAARAAPSPDDDDADAGLVDGVHPDWLDAERVLAEKRCAGAPQRSPGAASSPATSSLSLAYLVKWAGLGYADATWEWAADLTRDGDADAVAAFKARAAPRPPPPTKPPATGGDKARIPVPPFGNGRALRDYQETSLKWMMAARGRGRNVILGDEVGGGARGGAIGGGGAFWGGAARVLGPLRDSPHTLPPPPPTLRWASARPRKRPPPCGGRPTLRARAPSWSSRR